MLYRTFKEGKSYEAVCWRDAVQQYMTELENFKYDDAEAYKLFPCEDYKQISINVEEYRAKLAAEAKEQTNKAALSRSLSLRRRHLPMLLPEDLFLQV